MGKLRAQHRPYFRRLVTSGPGPREPEHAFGAIAIMVLFTLLFTYLFGGALSGSPRANG